MGEALEPGGSALGGSAVDHQEGLSRLRWRSLMPTRRVAATVLGVAATAWVVPALTHQWQDRQRARELQASLVTKIGRATTEALVTSQFLAAGRLPHTRVGGFNQTAFNDLDLQWQRDRAEIEAQLQAYYPGSALIDRWRNYSEFVRNTYFLVTDRQFLRDVTVSRIEELTPPGRLRQRVALMRTPFTDTRASGPRLAYYFASREVLSAKAAVTKNILSSSPRGFSTGASDLLNDLLP